MAARARQHLAEEALRGIKIALHQEIHRVPMLINRPIQIVPLAANFDAGLIKPDRAAVRARKPCCSRLGTRARGTSPPLSVMSTVSIHEDKPAHFQGRLGEHINEYIHGWTAKRGVPIGNLTRAQKQELVRELADDGAFCGSHAAAYISKILQMGRATVYNYRRDLK
ncbi:hypothetical protein AJ87_09545 [Rhizobium yanglingense]|nr:hypothetical protein AJ87_09545 [Rhizobium yanglingense]